jgi:hypothetical protein
MRRAILAATRNAHLWLPEYVQAGRRRREAARVERVWLTIGDHFEPYWTNKDDGLARERVALWRDRWPRIAERHRDSRGRPPQYTFFYPEEEYRRELLEPLAEMTRQGIADVEIHLHHDADTASGFVDRMTRFLQVLSQEHGLLRRRGDTLAFGFIHGNWSLDNARADGRWCGVNNEITLLRDLGCYADFTLPCVPDTSQAGPVNAIYWATDDPLRPRSHESGVRLRLGEPNRGDLLMVPGPLAVNWRSGRWKPRIETGELAQNDRPTRQRASLWVSHGPQLGGDVFVKLYAHGAQERNSAVLLDGDLDLTFSLLAEECARRGASLHFATAWETFLAIEALWLRADASATPWPGGRASG